MATYLYICIHLYIYIYQIPINQHPLPTSHNQQPIVFFIKRRILINQQLVRIAKWQFSLVIQTKYKNRCFHDSINRMICNMDVPKLASKQLTWRHEIHWNVNQQPSSTCEPGLASRGQPWLRLLKPYDAFSNLAGPSDAWPDHARPGQARPGLTIM